MNLFATDIWLTIRIKKLDRQLEKLSEERDMLIDIRKEMWSRAEEEMTQTVPKKD
jgi:hypothetical protein